MSDTAAVAEPRIGLPGLFALHLVLAWNIVIMLGPWQALAQTFFPPLLPVQFARIAVRLPDFTILCFVAAAMILLPLHALSKRSLQSLIPWPRHALRITVIVWTPMLSAELIRAQLMQPGLAAVPTECRGAASAVESLQLHLSEERPLRPHAWRVRDQTAELWSYRTLRFEPAGAWHGAEIAISRCRSNDQPRTSPGGAK